MAKNATDVTYGSECLSEDDYGKLGEIRAKHDRLSERRAQFFHVVIGTFREYGNNCELIAIQKI